MIQITQQDILAHQAVVPWPNPQQVEQDLLLCHSIVALFTDEFLKSQVAMRGGTLLRKINMRNFRLGSSTGLRPPAGRFDFAAELILLSLDDDSRTTF